MRSTPLQPLPPMQWGYIWYHVKAYEDTNGVIEAILEFPFQTRENYLQRGKGLTLPRPKNRGNVFFNFQFFSMGM